MRVALHTLRKPGKESEYERTHAIIPPGLDAALRPAGVTGWRIRRDGGDPCHVVEVAGYAGTRHAPRDHPAEPLEVGDDGLVRELP